MVYECRLNRFGRQHIYAALMSILGLNLLSQFVVIGDGYWWSSAIGIAVATGVSYLIGNTNVRTETNGEAVTVEHSGMVTANFTIDSLANVAVSGSGSMSRIVVVTKEGLKYFIPCECFSNDEIESLLKSLRNA